MRSIGLFLRSSSPHPHDLLGPAGARGASEAIYAWLGFEVRARFPYEVREKVTGIGDACWYQYGPGRQVIHAVGPQLSKDTPNPVVELTVVYGNVFKQFAAYGVSAVGWLLQVVRQNLRPPDCSETLSVTRF